MSMGCRSWLGQKQICPSIDTYAGGFQATMDGWMHTLIPEDTFKSQKNYIETVKALFNVCSGLYETCLTPYKSGGPRLTNDQAKYISFSMPWLGSITSRTPIC
eukprot:scaffold20738_cov67-Attheya_sp.AAC.5